MLTTIIFRTFEEWWSLDFKIEYVQKKKVRLLAALEAINQTRMTSLDSAVNQANINFFNSKEATKMCNKFFNVLLILTVISSANVNAGVEYTDVNYTKIHQMVVGSGGDVYLYADGEEINPAGCTGLLNRYTLSKTHAAYDETYALALGAYHGQYEVRFAIDDQACVNDSPKIVLLFSRRA